MREKLYWSLLERVEGQWCVAWGDWERSLVKEEWQDYRDNGTKASNLMIINSSGQQAHIDSLVRHLNQKQVAA